MNKILPALIIFLSWVTPIGAQNTGSAPGLAFGSTNLGTSSTPPATNAYLFYNGTTLAGGLTPFAVHSQTVSGAVNETLQSAWVTSEVFTFAASATVTLPQAQQAGQVLTGFVCQNGTGGFTPAFAPASGLTIVGTFPTFTTTASTCGDFSLTYTSTTQAYLSGSAAGPL